MANPLISVITATYNRKQYISDCINSIAASVFSPLTDITYEHIVFDDSSSDGTADYVRNNYPEVRLLTSGDNIGASASRDNAIKQARGKYIFVLDSDDVALQRTLYYFLNALQHYDKQWAFSDFIRVDGELRYGFKQDYYGWEYPDCKATLSAIFKGDHFIQHNVMFTKQLFEEVGGYDIHMTMAEDLDLFIRFLLKDQLPAYLPIVSHLHRMHESNLSVGQNHKEHMKIVHTLREKYHWND